MCVDIARNSYQLSEEDFQNMIFENEVSKHRSVQHHPVLAPYYTSLAAALTKQMSSDEDEEEVKQKAEEEEKKVQ